VVPDHAARSISHESTFAQDVGEGDVLRARLMELTQQVAWRLRRQRLRARTVYIKVRYHDFRTVSRSRTLPEASDVTGDLWSSASGLLETLLGRSPTPVRLVGMGVSGLERYRPQQRDLFEQDRDRQRDLDGVLDAIQDRFGPVAVRRATELRRQGRTDPED
jgi:DNA polymerase-4